MTEFKGKNVFVTGASGFIGGAIVRRLLDVGANVACLTRSVNSMRISSLQGATVFTGDVTDYHLMCEIISSQEIEFVFHMAANAIVRIGARDPMETYRTNVMGTVALLEAVRNVGRHTCKKVVVASSDKAYGDHDVLPYVESMALEPKNTYDTSKACTDMIARSYAHNYSMPIVVTRCSNVYGPGDPNDSRIIPNSIKRILSGSPPLLYSDVSEMEREFIYIDDVVDACLTLAMSEEHTNGQAYNVGGTGVKSVDEVVKILSSLMGSELNPIILPREPAFKEIRRQFIDASKLMQATGWTPKVMLVPGLRKTIQWYRSEE